MGGTELGGPTAHDQIVGFFSDDDISVRGGIVTMTSSLADVDVTRTRRQPIDGGAHVSVERVLRGGGHEAAKRTGDIVVAGLLLVASLPVWLVVGIAIRLDSRGPILERQRRVGLNGKSFMMLRFRTTSVDAEPRRTRFFSPTASGRPLVGIHAGPLVTPVGRILRRLSIDEIPQLWSVLKGEMSIVGPRPALPDAVDRAEVDVRERRSVLPGRPDSSHVSGCSASDAGFGRPLDRRHGQKRPLVHEPFLPLRAVAAGSGGVAWDWSR